MSKFFKKPGIEPNYQSPETLKLRQIAKFVGAGDYPAALNLINSALATATAPDYRGQLLGQAAQTMMKQGKFADAAAAFDQASTVAYPHPRAWYPLKMLNIKCLLKDAAVSEASTAASACATSAEQKWQEFLDARATAEQQFQQTGSFTVPIMPYRVSTVLSELGDAFLIEGEMTLAAGFFQQVVDANPRGGCRARQGLAEIALRSDDPDTAFQRSVEALTLGKFQAKTISSWKTLFAAKRKLEQPGVPAELLASVQTCIPSVGARTTLTIVKELRSANDQQWKTVANAWLAGSTLYPPITTNISTFPIIACELQKMLLADAKTALSDPTAQSAASAAILTNPLLAPIEWLSAAKELVRSSLFSGQVPNFSQLVSQGTTKYGSNFGPQIKHSLALSCMMAKRHDLARTLLLGAIADLGAIRNPVWTKAQWALGRMESFLGNYSAAATAYQAVATTSSVADRFRLQAKLLWAENLVKTGNLDGIDNISATVPAMIQGINDYDLLLNFARQLQKLGPDLRPLTMQVFQKGKDAAIQAFNTAVHPTLAIDALYKLTRRQLYDFSGYKDVIARWESMPPAKLTWMWMNNRQYWMYFALVAEAYMRANNPAGAAAAAGTALNDPATPREVLAIVGSPYYEALLKQHQYYDAMQGFQWLTTEYPTATGTSTAHYWIALNAYSTGSSELPKLVASLKASNAHTELTYEQWRYGAKAELLLCDLDVTQVTAQASQYKESFLTSMHDEILQDLQWVEATNL
jgi:tetratricopeptide (TPR) repeat protein